MLSNLMSYGLRLREPIRSDAARRTPNVRSFYSNGKIARGARLAFNTSVTKKSGALPQCQNVARKDGDHLRRRRTIGHELRKRIV